MNELSTFVEQAFRNYSESAVLRLMTELANNPGQKSEVFGLAVNYEYVLKRLLGAVLAREPSLKFNAYLTLTVLAKSLKNVRTEALYEHITTISNYKKNCEGKPIEIEAYIIGKILIFKALKHIFAGNLNAINHLSEVLAGFTDFEEQSIELLGELSNDKKSMALFSKLAPTTKAGFFLQAIFKARFKKTALELNEGIIGDIIAEIVAVYPKHSICLDYIAPLIKTSLPHAAKFFESHFTSIFDSNADVNVRQLYYILQLLQGHLKGVKLTAENIWELISVKVLGGWILQLKVKNKYIRKMAQNVEIDFDNDAGLAFKILGLLHESQLYLQNINHKHPLFVLYQNVEPHQYAKYLLDLIEKEANSEDEEKINKGYFNELEVFLVARHKELTVEEISKIVGIFISKYHQKQEQSSLQAINTIFNALLAPTQKKTVLLQTRASLILSKINFQELELGDNLQQVRQVAKKIRSVFKASKEEKDIFNISFSNFLLSVGFYFLVYPDEAQLFSDLEMAEKDIKSNILFSQSGIQSKKKRKVNSQSQKNKPIHILVDIFISLLTKSSQFLRTAINQIFQQLIPFIDGEDISHLLEVISKPDIEFIEDTQANE